MKKSVLFWIFIFPSILISGSLTLFDDFQLNRTAIETSKEIFTGKYSDVGQNHIDLQKCHIIWLEAVNLYHQSLVEKSRELFKRGILCSDLHLELTRKFLPNDLIMAEYAQSVYPEKTMVYYWIIYSLEKPNNDQLIFIYNKILEIEPNDPYAWRPLGQIFQGLKMYDQAINAFIISCENGDPFRTACHQAAGVYELVGDPVNALKYYRISKWEKSMLEVERLEADLSSQNP